MPEPGLAIAFRDLQGDVGGHLGYGRGADNNDSAWDADQSRWIERVVRGGLRRFYTAHSWSFLQPFALLSLAAGGTEIPLPDDYSRLSGPPTLVTTEGRANPKALVYSNHQVYQMHDQSPQATGQPVCCCVEPVKGTEQGQRYKIVVWPLADADYTLRVRYHISPHYLSGAVPVAYGGVLHAQTLLAACRAEAEVIRDNVIDGPQYQDFQRFLEQSKTNDGGNKAQSYGPMNDPSHGAGWGGRRERPDFVVTYNGELPG